MFWQNCAVEIREHIPLADKNTWRLGGQARFFAEPETAQDIRALLEHATRKGLRVNLLGGGSNILMPDGMLEGLTLRLKAPKESAIVLRDATTIFASGAAGLAQVLSFAQKNGLCGLEELAGIPGTLGGAAAMNAGSAALGIGGLIEEIHGLDLTGREIRLARNQLKFAYRWSNLQDMTVTGVLLRLASGEPEKIRATINERLSAKREHQPLGKASAGCVFKNPPEAPAGMLIDRCGLKGYRVGGAVVSDTHANFITNEGGATSADVRRVIDHIRETVLAHEGVELKLEIKIWM